MLNIPQAVRNLFLSGTVHKNLRVHFPNGERADITNDQIVKESMKFNESLCSRDALKFGMSEASSIEIETVGVENILGCKIEVGIEVDTSTLTAAQIRAIQNGSYDGALVLEADSDLGFGYYRVPLGKFTVTACPRSHGAMTHRRVIGYSDSPYAVAGEMSDFHTWLLSLEYANSSFDIMSEFIFADMYADIGAEWVNYFGYIEESMTDTMSQPPSIESAFPHIYADAKGAYSGIEFYFERATMQASGTTYAQHVYTFNAEYSYSLYQLNVKGAAARYAQFAESVIDYLENDQALFAPYDPSEYYYLDNGVKTYFTSKGDMGQFIARHAWYNWYAPSIEVTRSGTNVKSRYFLYQTPDTDDFYFMFSSDQPGTQPLKLYVPYTSWLNFVDVSAGITQQVNTLPPPIQSAVLNDLLIKSQYELINTNVSIESSSSRKQGRVTWYSYDGAVELGSMYDGMLEAQGKFGKTLRSGVLVPFAMNKDAPIAVQAENVESMWWDEQDIDDIGKVQYIFRDSDTDKEYTATVSLGDGTSVYRMVQNYFLKAYKMDMDWIAEFLSGNFKTNASIVGYTPTEATIQGMPWVEAGDYLAIETGATDVPVAYTFALQRTLKGIQHLTDDIVSVSGQIVGGETDYGS